MGYPEKRAPEGGRRQPSQKTWVSVAKKKTPPTQKTHPTDDQYYYYYHHTEAGTVAKYMTSSGRQAEEGDCANRRKKHGLPSQKTPPTQKTHPTNAKKHDQPSQKTCPPTRTVAKNTRHRCKKHLPREPSQKTQELATVAKNMSYRRKKHATHYKLPSYIRIV